MEKLELFEDVSKYNIGKFSILYEKNVVDADGSFVGKPNVAFHEYFHLVQSLSTIFGLWLFVNEIEIIFEHSYCFKTSHDKDKLFDSFKTLKKLRFSSHVKNIDIAAYRCAKVQFDIDTKFVCFGKATKKIMLKNDYPYPIVAAIFADGERTFKYDISARAICEAYSKAVEYELSVDFNYIARFTKLTKQICKNNQFEYYAVRLILESKFPGLSEKSLVVILHWSLNHVSPGVMFKDIVEFLEKKHGTKLPASNELSQEIFTKFFKDKFGEQKKLVKILENFVIQRMFIDTPYGYEIVTEDPLLNVLSEILCVFKKTLAYLGSDTPSIPCLEMYPFKTSNSTYPHVTELMKDNAKIVPLPLYQRMDDGQFFSIIKNLRTNFLFLDAMFFIVENLNMGGLNDNRPCPYEKICHCPFRGWGLDDKCSDTYCCTMKAALKYFK